MQADNAVAEAEAITSVERLSPDQMAFHTFMIQTKLRADELEEGIAHAQADLLKKRGALDAYNQFLQQELGLKPGDMVDDEGVIHRAGAA